MAAITISAPARRGPISRRPAESVGAVRVCADASVVRVRSTPSSARGPLRLTRRGRRLVRTAVVTLALLVALVTAVVAGVGVGASQAGDGAAVPATATVVVQPGQTLWGVARSVAPGADVRETVARIKELSGLSGAGADTVRPGQQLVVPAAG